MATAYPNGIDSITNPTASDTLDSATVPHATQHTNANDAIVAIETELGTNPKGSGSSVANRLSTLDSSLATKQDATAMRGYLNSSTTALDVYPRTVAMASSNNALGGVPFTFFTAPDNRTVTSITYISGSAASVTITLARFGLYTFDGTTATLVARTASDGTIFNTTSTAYTRNFDATGGYPTSYNLVAGQRYAVAFIVTGSGAGSAYAVTVTSVAAVGLAPRLSGVVTGQSDLPTSQSSFTTGNNAYYARLT